MAFLHAICVRPSKVLGGYRTIRASSHGITAPTMTLSRRSALRQLAWAAVALVTSTKSLAQTPLATLAAMYSSDTTPAFDSSGDPNKLSTYMPQIEAGYKTLLSLRDSWTDKTSAYDGDVVRRDLGTVGVKSPLFNIRKPLFKAWQLVAETSQDDAFIEDLETEWNDVVSGISSVDFQLYSVSFTELKENKDTLLRQGRAALDDLISIYSKMLEDFNSVQ